MKIAIRVDASFQIGTGHFMRCLTLADTLKQRGAEIRFICRYLPDYLQDSLRKSGYEFKLLTSVSTEVVEGDLAHSSWLGTCQHIDAQDSVHALSDSKWDWLIVDHYALDAQWESAVRAVSKKILVIDDIADRLHDCDLLLDQNYYANMDSRYKGKVPLYCRLLLGPRYALLRDEFRQLREKVKLRTGPVKRILVFFGGVDVENYTGRALESLRSIGIDGLHIDVVIGAQHPYREKIKSFCAENSFFCHVQTNRMAELMGLADLAIGAAGSASWERCCLGLPSLTVSLAYNQTEIGKGLDLLGACQYVGSQDTGSDTFIINATMELLGNNQKLFSLSEKAYATVDGQGVYRTCEALGC